MKFTSIELFLTSSIPMNWLHTETMENRQVLYRAIKAKPVKI